MRKRDGSREKSPRRRGGAFPSRGQRVKRDQDRL